MFDDMPLVYRYHVHLFVVCRMLICVVTVAYSHFHCPSIPHSAMDQVMDQFSLQRLFLAVMGIQFWWVVQSFAAHMWGTARCNESVRHESHDMSQLHHIHIT
jgi:hypothetical protein